MQSELNTNMKPKLQHPNNNGLYSKYIKRLLDFILSLSALIILSPLLIIVAILIKLDSKGPIFFTQERPGKDMKIFKVYKFRTMVQDAAKQQKVGVEVKGNDSRITQLGKFLRRFKIDELAQLLNILKGDMSIVGPRPTLPEYIKQYEKWELNRFDSKPGLTGFAQVNGNIYLERKEKSAYDIEYIEKISFVTDVRIILKTIAIVVFGEEKFINKSRNQNERGE
ncbi:sugar transferase [Sporosarcina trichiuri]|uniref:sugar transferase n=1 Tax=Sporosarcina trichiuri TaxID=3056445 RepID=UPI0025B60090|nr:sugar transferase [Sporosarcina sp. 0.2-SM1T-5]WJY26423.1 sugar transferase [Sporosarcina sp. 0.2-SM1T-5]